MGHYDFTDGSNLQSFPIRVDLGGGGGSRKLPVSINYSNN